MSLLLHLAMALTAGVVTFGLLPLLATALFGAQVGERVGNQFVGLAMAMIGRALLVLQGGGVGLELVSVSRDADTSTERCSLGGRRLDYSDPDGRMSRLAGYPFGLALRDKMAVVDARQLLLGDRYVERRRSGAATAPVAAGGGDTVAAKQAYFAFEPGRYVCSLRPISRIVQRSAQPSLVSRVRELIKVGLSRYNSSARVQYLIWLTAMGAGFGLIYIGSRLTDSGSSGSEIAAPPTGMIVGVVL
jgi:hypothetical protein